MAASLKFLGGPLLLTGLLLGALGLFALLRMSAAPASGGGATRLRADQGFRFQLFVLLLIFGVGAAIRLERPRRPRIMHPEAYIRAWTCRPASPSRRPGTAWAETASRHFHFGPHPFGYYLAMWGWTKLFGASVVSIRLPEALLGAASVLLIFRVGALSYGPRRGRRRRGFWRLHGFLTVHGASRPGCMRRFAFFGARLDPAAAGDRAAGTAQPLVLGVCAMGNVSLLACALTVEFTWPLLAVQMLLTALNHGGAAASRG